MRLPPAWRVAYKFDQIWWYQWHHCENSSAMFCYYVWSLININLYTFSYFKWVCVSGFQSVFAGQKLATPTCDPYITTFRRHWPAEIVWTKIPNVHVEHIHIHVYIHNFCWSTFTVYSVWGYKLTCSVNRLLTCILCFVYWLLRCGRCVSTIFYNFFAPPVGSRRYLLGFPQSKPEPAVCETFLRWHGWWSTNRTHTNFHMTWLRKRMETASSSLWENKPDTPPYYSKIFLCRRGFLWTDGFPAPTAGTNHGWGPSWSPVLKPNDEGPKQLDRWNQTAHLYFFVHVDV